MRNARRGDIGGFGVVSTGATTGFVRGGGAMPARAVSRCCADILAAGTQRISSVARAMAGECGNRTHPTLRSRVTVILKITEATRPHPPPRVSMNFDRNFSSLDDLSHDYRSRNA